ncbi:DUF4760 domain-containing protein [Xanthomonas campestris]|uniref:DUF4760 domain-containing protein n=1 Tax=Xanthomonas campestris TaxID=339 RepID=UPI0023792815|nr:DUF4760 domain-containing protein [Xanthomonas campestris]MEA9807881.1 DUF4760 domain-containing protein [Xanthomonas campestris pv. raphani]WDL16916.1 DUF4760 domain-containing protein [Xanthomonas campestris pv. campestris]WDL20998.1 DUF4760 domain-containing protein [Xanthomonas campestris pv. campestris]WDL26921.1 DUF4760 domain-containing protein [Xanthomonas campestris pv. campestris]WDL29170.1 DUF4760 domain-containing protein [Xanthomonas campestris pv. campestris]
MSVASFIVDCIKTAPTVPVILVGVYIAYRSLRSQRHLTRAKHTLDFDKEFKEKHKSTLIDARDVFARYTDEALAEVGDKGCLSKDDADPFTVVVNALNVWESVAIALKHDVYDEDLLFDAYATSVVWLYKNALPFVKARQKYNPKLFQNFVRLGVRWMAKASLPLALEKEIEGRNKKGGDRINTSLTP